ncbi:MAG TPA: YbaB/EbfC family nucleoid-associated protein [Nitrospira sp.]|jgi:DNA-binding YbaB/EbfC family protein|nr:ybaB [Nitrospira sp.]HET6677183.1 YbaB/EbfC family nucleoid-associated protein [Nitrospira sp.]
MKNPLGNMANLMKQAQQMQAQMAKLQEEAATKTVTGSAGGGMVTVTANGALEVVSVRIDPEALKDADAEMLQDVVLAATNEALKNARQLMAEQMKSVTGGMNIPGLF